MHIGGLERAGSVRRADVVVDVTSLLLDVDLDARLCASFEVSIVRRPCAQRIGCQCACCWWQHFMQKTYPE